MSQLEQDKATILIVDDTPENIDVLAGLLRHDYKLRVAKNGELALKLAQILPLPDLILLDIMMPGIDGYEVCRQLKSQPHTAQIPVIFITAKITPADEIKGLELGAVDYITKPITPQVAMLRVQTHLALYDQKRALYEQVKEQTKEINQAKLEMIQRLGRAAEYKDNETGMHVLRMAHYCRVLALACGMNEQDADVLLDAAPMHDIGKIGIPDGILLKPDKLTADEWQIMKSHVDIGVDILAGDQSSQLLTMASQVAHTHHEKWDGSGYPRGLAGHDIPLVGRIAAIADVFDALTSARPYKKAWTVEQAVDLFIQEKGKHFDPELVDLFVSQLDKINQIRVGFAD
ncbi:response regulator [Motilimonas pumila]|uniref:Two-component system response regulator n=1 Tax=Motilimonas pumila TaxID=2303987 RepID=A0A418YDC3_9GAMM|nr:two-component system response regulator [Motilimonas pumila]RJG42539.1 two-component system response regulator [Motilimonas pumila]